MFWGCLFRFVSCFKNFITCLNIVQWQCFISCFINLGFSLFLTIYGLYCFVFAFAHRQIVHSSLLSTLFFCTMPHFLLLNNLCKGSNWMSSWIVCHVLIIYSEIGSKIIYIKTFSTIHSIVSGLSFIIIDLVVIVVERIFKWVVMRHEKNANRQYKMKKYN